MRAFRDQEQDEHRVGAIARRAARERPFFSRLFQAYVNVIAVPFAVLVGPAFALGRAIEDARASARARARERELWILMAGIKAQQRHAVSSFEAYMRTVARLKVVFLRSVTSEHEAQIAFRAMQAHLDGLADRRTPVVAPNDRDKETRWPPAA